MTYLILFLGTFTGVLSEIRVILWKEGILIIRVLLFYDRTSKELPS